MKTITKTLNLLDVDDIEKALCDHFGKKIAISEVDCTLVHLVPCDTGIPSGTLIEFSIVQESEDFADSIELFYDYSKEECLLNGKPLSVNEDWVSKEEVFAFDVSAFKSFEEEIDGSD